MAVSVTIAYEHPAATGGNGHTLEVCENRNESKTRTSSGDLEVRVEATHETSEARRKVQAVSVVLPSFAMVCKTQKEIQESEVRKAGIERMKKEAAEKEAKAQAEREKKHPDPSVCQPVASKAPSTDPSTAPSKPPPQPVKPRPNETKSSATKPIEATAARHTYDNYGKWDNIDADADLDEVLWETMLPELRFC